MTANIRTKLGARLRELRQAKGMTQEQLAAACGVRQETVSKIESGRFNASVGLLQKLLDQVGGVVEIIEIS